MSALDEKLQTPISKSQKITISACIAILFTIWGVTVSILPPFYPSEAEEKGISPSQYGFVFGIAQLATVLCTPFVSKYGYLVGPKFVLLLGGIPQGICTLAFGFLTFIQDSTTFLVLSYFLRGFVGAINCGAWSSALTILIKIYPEKESMIVSLTEMFFGIGFAIGPAIGAWLYSVSGFMLPFAIMGSINLSLQLIMLLTLPNIKDKKPEELAEKTSEKKKKLGLMSSIKSPAILLPFLDNLVCFAGVSFIESMLEPHMKKAAFASQWETSTAFWVMGLVFLIATPISGYVCERLGHPVILSISGNFLMAGALLFIGPAPFLRMRPSTQIIIASCALIGFSYCQIMISTFTRAHKAAMRLGYEDSIQTYFLVSGLWSGFFSFGSFLGSTGSGFLVDQFGFRLTSLVIFSLYSIMTILDSLELFFRLIK